MEITLRARQDTSTSTLDSDKSSDVTQSKPQANPLSAPVSGPAVRTEPKKVRVRASETANERTFGWWVSLRLIRRTGQLLPLRIYHRYLLSCALWHIPLFTYEIAMFLMNYGKWAALFEVFFSVGLLSNGLAVLILLRGLPDSLTPNMEMAANAAMSSFFFFYHAVMCYTTAESTLRILLWGPMLILTNAGAVLLTFATACVSFTIEFIIRAVTWRLCPLEYRIDNHQLRIRTFSLAEASRESAATQLCTPCMKPFREDGLEEERLLMMPCGHVFHEDCITRRLSDIWTCPVCFRLLNPDKFERVSLK